MTHDLHRTYVRDDERLIDGIANYCHRWCERCPFTGRCVTFRLTEEYNQRHPDRGVIEQVQDSFQDTYDLLEEWCRREGIDFEQLCTEANSEEAEREMRRLDDQIEAAEPYKLAMAYGEAAHRILDAMEAAGRSRGWSPAVPEALNVIGWYSHFIAAKVRRGFHGRASNSDDDDFIDAVQNDWNGSIKAARFAIAESTHAWQIVLKEGEAAVDSPLRSLVEILGRIDTELAREFPRAMDFVRPGFDEPEIAAGALSTLACYEPRQASGRQDEG